MTSRYPDGDGLDTRLIADGTYFLVEADGRLAGCGGWSRRAIRRGCARCTPIRTSPAAGSAGWCCGWPSAAAEGFAHAELAATLAGVPLYAAYGWREIEPFVAAGLPLVRMGRRLVP